MCSTTSRKPLCATAPQSRFRLPWPSTYPAESSLYTLDLDANLLGPERIIHNEQFLTSTGTVHDRKFYNEQRDWQPGMHRRAPSSRLVNYIMPDCHRKMQGTRKPPMKPYNPHPPKISETRANFGPHYPEPGLYGQAGIFVTEHHVNLPANRVNVVPAFTYDDMFSVLRKAHPYMTTYRINHKNFEDELPQHEFLNSLEPKMVRGKKVDESDCAIKSLVRPMLDPFEQTVYRMGRIPSLDVKRENPGDIKNPAHLKEFFGRPPYQGCLPRVHQPVPHLGLNTTYKDTYDRPLHPNMALNVCHDDDFCYVQPKLSSVAVHKTPAPYTTEAGTMYGRGVHITRFV